MRRPPLGAVVLYTLGEVRAAPHESYGVCTAEVEAHNRDGTVALRVETPAGPAWRSWVPEAAAPSGTRAAAGKWSPAPPGVAVQPEHEKEQSVRRHLRNNLNHLIATWRGAVAALYARAHLLCALALVLPACATTGVPPMTPCNAWMGAEFGLEVVRQQVAAQRAIACAAPPPAPAPAVPVCEWPLEIPPPAPRAAPEQVPLPGLLPRE